MKELFLSINQKLDVALFQLLEALLNPVLLLLLLRSQSGHIGNE